MSDSTYLRGKDGKFAGSTAGATAPKTAPTVPGQPAAAANGQTGRKPSFAKVQLPSKPTARRHLATVSTNPDELAALAKSKDTLVRAFVARNRNTPPEVLRTLTKDSDGAVILNALANGSTPVNAIEPFYDKPLDNAQVGCALVENPNTPPEVLSRWSHSPNSRVRWFVADNPNLPTDDLMRLVQDSHDDTVVTAATNPSLPTLGVAILLAYQSPHLRRMAQKHPNYPHVTDEERIEGYLIAGSRPQPRV